MIALVFLVYALLGAGAGWALHTYAAIELPIAICSGANITALIGQVHILASRSGKSDDLANRIDVLESSQRDNAQQMDVVEARTAAIETTVKQELTERRDAG